MQLIGFLFTSRCALCDMDIQSRCDRSDLKNALRIVSLLRENTRFSDRILHQICLQAWEELNAQRISLFSGTNFGMRCVKYKEVSVRAKHMSSFLLTRFLSVHSFSKIRKVKNSKTQVRLRMLTPGSIVFGILDALAHKSHQRVTNAQEWSLRNYNRFIEGRRMPVLLCTRFIVFHLRYLPCKYQRGLMLAKRITYPSRCSTSTPSRVSHVPSNRPRLVSSGSARGRRSFVRV